MFNTSTVAISWALTEVPLFAATRLFIAHLPAPRTCASDRVRHMTRNSPHTWLSFVITAATRFNGCC